MTCPSAHGTAACCTRCTSVSDGLGFPHPMVAQGRRRLQQCPHCSDWVDPSDWVNDIRGVFFGCRWCHTALSS